MLVKVQHNITEIDLLKNEAARLRNEISLFDGQVRGLAQAVGYLQESLAWLAERED